MVCNECGYSIPEDSAFCPFCGTKVVNHAAEPEEGKSVPVTGERSTITGKKSGPKPLFAVLAAALLCVVAGGAVGFLHGGRNVHRPSAEPEKAPEQAAVSEFYVDLEDQEQYARAMDFFEEGSYQAAIDVFEGLEGSEDAKQMLKKCWFELGKQSAAEKDYDRALVHLLKADAADAAPFLVECYYDRMMRAVEAEDWEAAYTNCQSGLRYEGADRAGLEGHQYQVYTAYARLMISRGTEWECRKAIGALDGLMDSVGETDELKELKQEAEYLSALALLEEKKYIIAIEHLADITDYKDSREKWFAAMDLFVRKMADYGAQSPVFAMNQKEIYEYANILSENNYKGDQAYYLDMAGLAS